MKGKTDANGDKVECTDGGGEGRYCGLTENGGGEDVDDRTVWAE